MMLLKQREIDRQTYAALNDVLCSLYAHFENVADNSVEKCFSPI